MSAGSGVNVLRCAPHQVMGNSGTQVEQGTHEQLLRVPKRASPGGLTVPALRGSGWVV